MPPPQVSEHVDQGDHALQSATPGPQRVNKTPAYDTSLSLIMSTMFKYLFWKGDLMYDRED